MIEEKRIDSKKFCIGDRQVVKKAFDLFKKTHEKPRLWNKLGGAPGHLN